ncbi:Concanavalin A-like lectin/glucanases superfamily [Corchorus capsularis]|uniref:Concanavalin A-like lectin/glucanases superfamily n=1 Tax=Corchorus capsularis TaxID=210143 RepID=A0A1R3K9V2_COCAP|nr:Concanavalin A-like lectin/glucanases superfamily [Corchorus capsularis]
MKASYCYSLLLILLAVSAKEHSLFGAADPTDGFTQLPLTDDNFDLQKPYNIPLSQRYNYSDGIRSLWVYNNDKPFKHSSGTRPRTEIRIKFQIHGAAEGATTLQLRIYDGNMRYYKYNLVATDLYDKWFRVNVIHDVNEGKITVFIDGEQKFVVKDQGPGDLYFKCGVYAAPENSSNFMESRWRDIKLFKK